MNGLPGWLVQEGEMTPNPPAPTRWELDRELIGQTLSGSRTAARALYERHVGRVYTLALRLGRNPEIAKDITQEAFLKMFRSLSQYRADASFETWLHRMTWTVAIDWLRREKRWKREATDLEEAPVERLGHTEATPELRITLLEALDSLPEDDRFVLFCHDVEGYTHREIAERLEIPEGTSKSRLSGARAKVREWLSRREPSRGTER